MHSSLIRDKISLALRANLASSSNLGILNLIASVLLIKLLESVSDLGGKVSIKQILTNKLYLHENTDTIKQALDRGLLMGSFHHAQVP
jgi:hypothetical protein